MLSLSLQAGEVCGCAGHIFDGILGIKSCIKVMSTLKFAVPETWHEPIARAPVLSKRRRGYAVAAYYDFPGRDGIAEGGG